MIVILPLLAKGRKSCVGLFQEKQVRLWRQEQEEKEMAIETDELGPGWDGVQPTPKGGGKRQNDNLSLFMKLEPRPEPYRIRLACTPIRFRKHRWAFRSLKQWPISPATDPSEKDLDIAWKEGRFMPVTRFAAFVFDREHERLRILEDSGDVYGPIGNHAHATKTNAASPTKGWDWLILVTETTNANGSKGRICAVTIDTSKNGPTPFTEEEIKVLENPKFQREELEKRYFIKCTPEEIKDLWEQLPASAKINTPVEQSKQPNAKKAETKSNPVVNTAAKVVNTAPAEPPQEKVEDVVPQEDVVADDDFLKDTPEADGDDIPARMF